MSSGEGNGKYKFVFRRHLSAEFPVSLLIVWPRIINTLAYGVAKPFRPEITVLYSVTCVICIQFCPPLNSMESEEYLLQTTPNSFDCLSMPWQVSLLTV